MKAWMALAGAALGALVPAMPAGASGDYGCDPVWKLASDSYGGCGNRAALAPGNDTRVNLFLLLREAQGAPAGKAAQAPAADDRAAGQTFFSWSLLRRVWFAPPDPEQMPDDHAGSRCISLASGATAFADALRANRGVPAAEAARLGEARGLLARRCDGTGAGAEAAAWPTGVTSPAGREFLAYLQSADAFYAEDWAGARKGFAALFSARDPWVAETAAYMLARVELNAAQAAAFDEYGYFAGAEKVDAGALGRARAGFDAYVQRFGQGRYAASARGLQRRALWLGGNTAGLARAYEALLLSVPASQPASADLVEEVDGKLLTAPGAPLAPAALDGPLLLATLDLLRMRDPETSDVPRITAAELAAQQPRFAGRAELYAYVLAAHAFYVEKDMAKVLQLTPDDARRPAYGTVAFSRQVLRGMALAARRDRNEGGFWRELLGGATAPYQRSLVELALAMNLERSGRLGDVFAPGSPVGDTTIREILLQSVAGPDILRAQARARQRPRHERDLALFTLLSRQLERGDYAGWLADSALIPADASVDGGLWELLRQEDIPLRMFRGGTWSDGYPCPALARTVATLAAAPRDVKARLCLGDFWRLNGFDGFDLPDARPRPDALGGTPSLFPGRPVPRSAIYADVIADPAAAAGDKAYALYRSVMCYAPSKNNTCGGADVPESQRRAWFQRLKRDFPQSPWTQKLRYYW